MTPTSWLYSSFKHWHQVANSLYRSLRISYASKSSNGWENLCTKLLYMGLKRVVKPDVTWLIGFKMCCARVDPLLMSGSRRTRSISHRHPQISWVVGEWVTPLPVDWHTGGTGTWFKALAPVVRKPIKTTAKVFRKKKYFDVYGTFLL